MILGHNVTKLVSTAVAVAALGLTVPGNAVADPTDDAFSRKLFADAVDFGPQPIAVQKARVVCEAFGAGMSPAEVHDLILSGSAATEGSSFSPRQAAVFMADAVQFYCPKYANLFMSD